MQVRKEKEIMDMCMARSNQSLLGIIDRPVVRPTFNPSSHVMNPGLTFFSGIIEGIENNLNHSHDGHALPRCIRIGEEQDV
jgi:hypothetical protein